MNQTLVKQKKFTETLSMIAVGIIGLIFVILTVASILQTSHIDPVKPSSETILFDDDVFLVNIALIVLSLIACIALMRSHIRLSGVDTRFILFVMIIVTTIISLVWINLVQSIASGEARLLLDTAKGAANDDYSYIRKSYYSSFSYYQYYPSQLGYVFFAEIIYRIFGSGSSDLFFQIPNVIALNFAYVGVVMITHKIFGSRTVTNMTAIALTVCLQPMFMTTYTYSFIIGLAFAVWSVFFTVRYIQENKLKDAGIAALLIMFAVMIRYNYAIILAAICIALILHTIGTKRLLALAAAAVMAFCAIGGQRLLIFTYAERSSVELDSEVTPIISAYLGVSESTMAPGWFNWNAMTTLRDSANTSKDHQLNTAIAEDAALKGIDARITALNKENMLLEFFKKKFLSQFNEPSFESVWISQTRAHDTPKDEPLPAVVTSVYSGGLGVLLERWFPYYTMMIYFGFAAGMIWMIFRRRLTPEAIILPTAVLGAVLYHMACEGKSQFFLPYFVLLIPFAMYGLYELSAVLKKKTNMLFMKPNETADESESA